MLVCGATCLQEALFVTAGMEQSVLGYIKSPTPKFV